MRKSVSITLFSLLVLFISCSDKRSAPGKAGQSRSGTTVVYYAQGFEIENYTDYKVVKIKNPWNPQKTVQNYVLVPRTQALPEQLPDGILLRTPLQKTVAFSAVVCGMLDELNVLSTLVGVAESQYIAIPSVQASVANGAVRDVGQASNPNIEQLMWIEPEAIFINPVNESSIGTLAKLSVPAIPCLEWKETHPLGQAEWIRVIGLLFDKQALADSLFFVAMSAYNDLKAQTDAVAHRPTVFAEKKHGDFWYMPGGKSYFAHLLEDAGADYLFKDNEQTGSISYAFEQILDRAAKADYWLFKYYSPQDANYKQLADEYANYALFDAYRKRHIYVCNTLKTAHYYHELPLHPDWVLKDLIRIFHPELLPEYRARYYFLMKD
ncbi:MAG: iron complex transport system substrate-binding protein [Candidatus Ordinivivax streblomastigis]|uniref:Iron complex transport system substrate-binding protein n=1 Tax=Candidatus Ordinivivax streblomastigis TaxID=2540710 RepID=A0A5M8P110_9BACT|nr:MAG: iron complex transport system substrate-binding protein [Candidatus Ordinivivax streblomastigis]